jgi:hypothetical protein
MATFDQLWEQAENQQARITAGQTNEQIIEELRLKINLYQTLSSSSIPAEEQQDIKTRTMGEVLLTLTKLSLKDNINVYQALQVAMRNRI